MNTIFEVRWPDGFVAKVGIQAEDPYEPGPLVIWEKSARLAPYLSPHAVRCSPAMLRAALQLLSAREDVKFERAPF